LGWPTLTTDPTNNQQTLLYDRDGLLKRIVTRRSLNIDVTYDSVHRPIQRVGTSTVTWTYNDDSLKVISGSAQSTDTLVANLRGQPIRMATRLHTPARTYTQTFHYRQAGLLDTVRAVGLASDSFVVRAYGYDTQQGRLSSISLRSQTTTLDYDGNSDITKFSYPFSAFDSLAPRGGLTSPLKHTSEAATNAWVQRWMGYNAVGQIDRHLRQAERIGRWFTYDSLGQLRRARTRSRNPDAILPTGCPNHDFGMSGACTPDSNYVTLSDTTYLYSAIGNRLDLSANYDATGTRITFFNGCNYSTDVEGNTTRRATGFATCPAPIDSLVWNAEGQLTRLVFPSGVNVAYYYNAAGQVVRKDSAGAARAYFLWSGDHLLAELNGTGTSKTAEYVYYPGLDNPQALILGQSIYRPRRDGLGNVIALTDSANAFKRLYTYDDWGLLTSSYDSAGFINNRDRARWKGALWMGPEADIYFMRNRWYEPATGRFFSEDPIGLAGGINLFGYAANDPINGRDPHGLCQEGEELWVNWREWPDGSIQILGFFCVAKDGGGGGSNLGGGGRGSGEVLASPPRSPSPVTARCLVAGGLFVASLALDATLVGGIYVRGAVAGFRFAGALIVGGFGRFAERGAFVKSMKSLDAASSAMVANAASDLTPRASYIGVASSLSIASGLPTPSWKDFAPIVGTKRAFDTAVAACNE
jgi:RHS repeat-associated protein